ncbi:LPS export ABC transporter permease LptF [Derxia lacustris]|uniref:LPS export ABC transporter permease LptF n=1 Tax=Derxia lacustris TaxID=764842 RepID=UPI000A16CF5E|nr:LPS export ABC transporter permease LptF [Derxia lacustris]
MIFERALRKELVASATGVFITLVTIVITTTLIRILGQAAAGKAGADAVVLLIGFAVLNVLPMLLVVSLFISTLLVLTRMYADSEMVVWFSCGVSLRNFIKPVLRFAAPWIALVFLFAMFVAPWANQQSREIAARFEQRDDISKVASGQFIETAGSDRVFFVEDFDAVARAVSQVFAALRVGDVTTMIVARDGHVESRDGGERYLVLGPGRRYEFETGHADGSIGEFDSYAIRLESRAVQFAPAGSDARTMTADQLGSDTTPKARGELLWRLGLPLLAINLVLLAIPLAFVNPRAGRSANLIFAVLLYVIYWQLMSLSQAMVGSGRLHFGVGVWLVHALVAGGVAAMFVRRSSAARLDPLAPRTWRMWLGGGR